MSLQLNPVRLVVRPSPDAKVAIGPEGEEVDITGAVQSISWSFEGNMSVAEIALAVDADIEFPVDRVVSGSNPALALSPEEWEKVIIAGPGSAGDCVVRHLAVLAAQ